MGQAGIGESARQTEVRHPDRPLLVDQEVGGLDVAMDHAMVVRMGQGLGRLEADFRNPAKISRSAGGSKGGDADSSSRWLASEAPEAGIVERSGLARPWPPSQSVVLAGAHPLAGRVVSREHGSQRRPHRTGILQVRDRRSAMTWTREWVRVIRDPGRETSRASPRRRDRRVRVRRRLPGCARVGARGGSRKRGSRAG